MKAFLKTNTAAVRFHPNAPVSDLGAAIQTKQLNIPAVL